MAIVVYPLNNIDFSAEDVAIYNSTRTSGIFAGDDFAISLNGSDNTISIDVGLAWMHLSRFNGVAVALKGKTFVDMGLPDAVYPRIDALVLQFDANKNGADLVVKSGTASSNPQPPAVSRTEALYELHLLHARRSPGAASISVADVTDLRFNEQYCGLMADAVTRVDTAAIDAQISALIQKLQDDLEDVEAQDYYASKEFVQQEVRAAAPFNYADNSDFTHFVAQAGIGGNHGNQAYAGDRWILDSGAVTGDAREDGSGYTNITLNGTIRQIVADAPDVGTAAVEMVSGTADISYANGEIIITSNGGVIKNVRLFRGNYDTNNMAEYQPKGYAAEKLECQRYYVQFALRQYGNTLPLMAIATTQTYGFVPLPTKMRVAPTVTGSSLSIRQGSTDFAITSLDISGKAYETGVVLNANVASGLTKGSFYVLRVDNGTLSFSADL